MNHTRLMWTVLLALTLLVLAVVVTVQVQPLTGNPFAPYAEWMPGRALPVLADGCVVEGSTYPSSGFYLRCYPDDAAFRVMLVTSDYERVTGVSFYPNDMRGGELLLWLGQPEYVRRMGRTWVFYWATASAYTRRGSSRFEARVVMVWFRKGW